MVQNVFNSIIMMLVPILVIAVYIVLAVLYCIFIVPICNHAAYGVWFFAALIGCLGLTNAVEKLKNEGYGFGALIGILLAFFICMVYEGQYEFSLMEKGPTLITKFHITKGRWIEGDRSRSPKFLVYGHFQIGDKKFGEYWPYEEQYYLQYKEKLKFKNSWTYIMYNLDCPRPVKGYRYPNPKQEDIDKIHDFAFMEDGKLYSYHDYALKHPDLVHSTVGFNLIYKARCRWYNAADSVVSLYFIDQNYNEEMLWYRLGRNEVFSDTLLIYRNLLDDNSYKPTLYVCLPELNTPENRAKINKYGYIFHHDICSKEEIETQCPRIKEYVDSKLATSFEIRFYNDEPVFALPQKKD